MRIKSYSMRSYYGWGIVEKNCDKLIGEIFMVNNNERMLSCEAVYGMAKYFRNNGYTTEALTCVIHHLLLDVGYNRIQAGHNVNNPASGRVMQKAGMKYEGTLRQTGLDKDGSFLDGHIYGILRTDITKL